MKRLEDSVDVRRTVLVVDDHLSIGLILGAALAAHDFKVLTASSAAQALDICRHYTGAIDVVLCAFGLTPDGSTGRGVTRTHRIENGLAVMRQVVEMRPSMKIVFFSGHSDETIEPARIPQHWPVLRRPCDLRTLLKALGEAPHGVAEAPVLASPRGCQASHDAATVDGPIHRSTTLLSDRFANGFMR
jgi:ActR/RegA family two-component response regulator